MSKPRGKAIQRELVRVAKDTLKGKGCEFEVDFSKRGGHQQLHVTLPNGSVRTLEICSTPRNEVADLDQMRQVCNRLIRDNLL